MMLPGVEAILICDVFKFVATYFSGVCECFGREKTLNFNAPYDIHFESMIAIVTFECLISVEFSSKLISHAMLPRLLGVTGADKEVFGGTGGSCGRGGNDVPSSESSEKSSSSLLR